MKKTETAAVCALLFLVVIFIWITPSVSADKDAAGSMHENAEISSGIAFEYLKVIDESGGDISELKYLLNNALVRLADSQLAFNNGDYDQALSLAREAQELSVDAILLAEHLLPLDGSSAPNYDVEFAIIILKTFIVSVVAYFGWRFLRQVYINNILQKRVEVVRNES